MVLVLLPIRVIPLLDCMGFHNMKRIINCETGEVLEVELSQEELNQQAIDEAAAQVVEAKAAAKAAQRQALLNRLGISEEEAQLLLS